MPPPAAGDSPRGSRSMARCVPRARPPGLGGGDDKALLGGWAAGGHKLPGCILGLGGVRGGGGGEEAGRGKRAAGKSKGREGGAGGPAAEPDGKGAFCPQNRPRSARMGPAGPGATGAARGRRGSVPPPLPLPSFLVLFLRFFFFSLPPFKRQTPCREIRISRGKCRALIGCGCRSPASRQPAAPGGGGP